MSHDVEPVVDTIGGRVTQMQRDLAEITYAFNLDESYETAAEAQAALLALGKLDDRLQEFGAELAWGWRPTLPGDRR